MSAEPVDGRPRKGGSARVQAAALARLDYERGLGFDIYSGKVADLVKAGLVRPDQLPGRPGMPLSGGARFKGKLLDRHEPYPVRDEHYVEIELRGNDDASVRIGVIAAEYEKRVAPFKNDSPWVWPDLSGHAQAELSSWPGDGPEKPIFQYFAVRTCLELKAEIDRGGRTAGFAVLAAVRKCGTHGLVMPLWLVYAFNRRYDAVLNCRTASWDDPSSFGRPYPKGTQIKARRKARLNRPAVFVAVRDILNREPETPIDKALFEIVGKPLGLGATLAEEYYYSSLPDFMRKKQPAKFGKRAGIQKRPR